MQLQTHDQVGNRAFGERLDAQLAAAHGRCEALRACSPACLLAPSPPMLFMGEEFAASSPFLYFCDFSGEFARAVTDGRRAEFGRFASFADPALRTTIPDPNDARTFERSRLDWHERDQPPHAAWLALYTHLLQRRQARLVPCLASAGSGSFRLPIPGTLDLTWPLAGGRRWRLLARLDDAGGPVGQGDGLTGEMIYASHPLAARLPAWSVYVTLETP
jgi:maltooligosyltrehalose trehalohydrolase